MDTLHCGCVVSSIYGAVKLCSCLYCDSACITAVTVATRSDLWLRVVDLGDVRQRHFVESFGGYWHISCLMLADLINTCVLVLHSGINRIDYYCLLFQTTFGRTIRSAFFPE